MLSLKRTQIRSQLRRDELQQIFSLRRKELTDGRAGIFRELFVRVEEESLRGTSMELVGALLGCHQSHPDEENSYVLISNYLFNHNDALPYFYSRLIESPQYLENQMWSLTVVVFILSEQATRSQPEDRYLVTDQMEDVMAVAADIVREMLASLKRSQSATEKQINVWLYFMEVLGIQLSHHLYNDFPRDSLALFAEVLAMQLPVEQGQPQELIATWKCLEVVFRSGEEVADLRDLMADSRGIFWLTLRDLPHERQSALQLLTTLLVKHPSDFMSTVYHPELVTELLYLLEQVPKLKPLVVHFLKLVLGECSMDQLMKLLGLGAHTQLTTTLEWSIASRDNECLEDCLICIYNLLRRLQNEHETRLLARVQDEIEVLRFDQMIEGMAGCHQNPTVWNYLSLIIDDFYSSEDEDEAPL